MMKKKVLLLGTLLQFSVVGCMATGQKESGVKQRLSSQTAMDALLDKMGPGAKDDARYVHFYKISGLMHAVVTRDEAGNDLEKDLGLISWAPATVSEAKANYRQHPTFGTKYNIDALVERTNKKKIFHFMQINGNFALHSRYAGSGRSPANKNPNLNANGKLDRTGHGCVRIQDKSASFGGHQYLWDLGKTLSAKYAKNGNGIPIIVDYSAFINPAAVPNDRVAAASAAPDGAPSARPTPPAVDALSEQGFKTDTALLPGDPAPDPDGNVQDFPEETRMNDIDNSAPTGATSSKSIND